MKRTSRSTGFVFGLLLAINVLAGCASHAILPTSPQEANGRAVNQLNSGGYKSLYSFEGTPDGAYPMTRVTVLNDILYGTTSSGGRAVKYGTVFEISKSGKERVLYSFKGGADGADPNDLAAINGVLYGTTRTGGSGCKGPGESGCGTVFRLTLSGKKHLIYTFKGGSDGETPTGRLIAANGELYGVTVQGGLRAQCGNTGSNGCGTVFEVSASGKEKILYRFNGGDDGANPQGTLLADDGKLFGTTPYGGKPGCDPNNPLEGCGTVFTVSTSGIEKVLYRFKGKLDGGVPTASLIKVNGAFYGATSEGGLKCGGLGCGTVFKVSTSGKEAVLYRFKDSPDGATPLGMLRAMKGMLFGSTISGGKADCGNGAACGTIYKVSTAGAEEVLHSFKGVPDGALPEAGLTTSGSILYGTTDAGGGSGCGDAAVIGHVNGCGTVFKISP